MKKKAKSAHKSREYDFSKGIRGKYADKFAERSNIVVIDPDLADVFPNAKSVNAALRGLAKLIKETKKAS